MKLYLDPAKLPANVRRDIQSFIIENNVRGADIAHLSPYEALDFYLRWNGIINWTSHILDAVNGIKKAEIPKPDEILTRT